MVHRDIKRENIFYDAEHKNAVIADLGMARTRKKRMTGGRECSTKSYLAPEMILESEYDYKCDMWALGCVCYEMLIFADEGGSMFSESNPYHLTLARQYAVNKTIFGKDALQVPVIPKADVDGEEWDKKRASKPVKVEDENKTRKVNAPKFGNHNISSLAQKEIGWVKRRWSNLEKQMAHFCSAKGWTAEFEEFVPGLIKGLLQFYPQNRLSSQEMADVLSRSKVCEIAGPLHIPKLVKQSEVNESFAEQISKLKGDKKRGLRVKEKLKELVDARYVVNPYIGRHSKDMDQAIRESYGGASSSAGNGSAPARSGSIYSPPGSSRSSKATPGESKASHDLNILANITTPSGEPPLTGRSASRGNFGPGTSVSSLGLSPRDSNLSSTGGTLGTRGKKDKAAGGKSPASKGGATPKPKKQNGKKLDKIEEDDEEESTPRNKKRTSVKKPEPNKMKPPSMPPPSKRPMAKPKPKAAAGRKSVGGADAKKRLSEAGNGDGTKKAKKD